jgi:hypothetical protein
VTFAVYFVYLYSILQASSHMVAATHHLNFVVTLKSAIEFLNPKQHNYTEYINQLMRLMGLGT